MREAAISECAPDDGLCFRDVVAFLVRCAVTVGIGDEVVWEKECR